MKLKLIAMALVAALAFTGCASKPTTAPVEENTTKEEVVAPEESTEEVAADAEVVTYTTLEDPTGEKKNQLKVDVTYVNGEVTDLAVDLILEDGSSKRASSEAGEYVMKEGEEFAWHEQVDMVVDFIKANNFDPSVVNFTDDAGHTDAVSGVSIKVASYVNAIAEALALDPAALDANVATAEVLYDEAGEKKDMIVVTSNLDENGQPTDLFIDVILEDGSSKRAASEAGAYVMKEGEEFAWHEQMDMLQEFVVANNFDLGAITLTDDAGHTDAVASVSIKVGRYVVAVEQLLAGIN